MSTTTVGDLLDRASHQARSLRFAADPIDLKTWQSFDVTAHRLLRELVGPRRTLTAEGIRAHAPLATLLEAYPEPLNPPAPTAGGSTPGRDIPPADPTSDRALDRLSVTLGVLADLLNQARQRDLATDAPHPVLEAMLNDTETAPVVAQLLAITAVAGRHALTHLPLADVDRSLAVARYAERGLDTLDNPRWATALSDLASFAPSFSPAGATERLEAALRAWATSARGELARTIPSTEVLRNVTNQAVHLYAATDLLVATSRSTSGASGERVATRAALRDAALAMRRLEPLWAAVTTATRPTHEYASAAKALYDALNALICDPAAPNQVCAQRQDLRVDRSLDDLRHATADLADLLHTAASLPDLLIRSEVLYAPARILPATPDRLRARQLGRLAPLQPHEGMELQVEATEAATAASGVHAHLTSITAQSPLPAPPPRPTPAPSVQPYEANQDAQAPALL